MLKGKYYSSPIGKMLMIIDDGILVDLYFVDNINENKTIKIEDDEAFLKVSEWLDAYFKGLRPKINQLDFLLKGTKFRQHVWQELLKIPYGKTISYASLAKILGINSARAIGQAVANNPLLIIVPCHRVIGTNGKLVGYAGGLERKKWLLDLECI